MAHFPDSPFLKHLDCIKDPRRHNTRHLLYDMLPDLPLRHHQWRRLLGPGQ